MKVINRKNITLNKDLNVSRTWSQLINLNFQPDEMIVKLISSQGNPVAPSGGVCMINCNTINEKLGSFTYNSIVCPNLQFEAKNYPINTEWNFTILDASNNAPNATFDSELCFHLEFLKYE